MESASAPRSIIQKVWDSHIVHAGTNDSPDLLYADFHVLFEINTVVGFEGLTKAGRAMRRPNLSIATVDHIVPTHSRALPITDAMARGLVETMEKNARKFGVRYEGYGSPIQGIVHVMAPELGLIQPGMFVVSGDSHTSTLGAFGCLGFGIGTTETEHVLATQCLWQKRQKTMKIEIDGELPAGTTAKDLILGIIRQISVSGATGHLVEYCGSTIRNLSMEGRMTVCNMSIEAGAKAGLIAPDETTFEYLRNRRYSPQGEDWDDALDYWRSLVSDEGAHFDRCVKYDATQVEPFVTWGTNPGQSVPVGDVVPDPYEFAAAGEREAAQRALAYQDLKPGTPIQDISIDRVFIGSCTNSRIEDLRTVAEVVRGRKVHERVEALIVPGSSLVKAQAEQENLDKIFQDAGFQWREPSCSMCLGMNPDVLAPGQRCASTSNRNFEGRQGPGGRTHLVSPAMAAGAAIAGHFVDIRSW